MTTKILTNPGSLGIRLLVFACAAAALIAGALLLGGPTPCRQTIPTARLPI